MEPGIQRHPPSYWDSLFLQGRIWNRGFIPLFLKKVVDHYFGNLSEQSAENPAPENNFDGKFNNSVGKGRTAVSVLLGNVEVMAHRSHLRMYHSKYPETRPNIVMQPGAQYKNADVSDMNVEERAAGSGSEDIQWEISRDDLAKVRGSRKRNASTAELPGSLRRSKRTNRPFEEQNYYYYTKRNCQKSFSGDQNG
ncbi:uncharacterized protein LOC129773039 [Toxorhynchites rutilus septentrionalis]|uniref:uncharacterized protein LOC129773039 n=1 Tax=Toxorhynchites rutilus septentrionalis TaxID=329112 RepID=UPI00247A6C96|nr:uncharacterized protein LOC129773039 [Toxorhynchites rutilus septentrionalis]